MLVRIWPKLSETFILEELLGLERLGLPLRLYALGPATDAITHPAVASVRAPLAMLPASLRRHALDLAARHARLAGAAPLRYLGTLAYALRRGAQGLRDFARGGWLAAQLRRDGVPHLHCHFISTPGDIAELASRLLALPFSISAHAKDIYLSEPRDLERKLRAARFTVTCTEANRQALAAIAPQAAVHRMYHGVDHAQFHPARRVLAGSQTPLIVSVGRLREKKGLDVLIDACALLRDRGHAFACEIVGYGEEQPKLQAKIDRLELGERMRLVGKLAREQVIDRYARATVYVQPSRIAADGDRDGIPNVLLEAMAMGLPVVATRVSGIPELVGHGVNGVLVEPDDPSALADAIGHLLQRPAACAELGCRARDTVTEQFDNDRNLRLLCELLNGSEPAPAPAARSVAYVMNGFPRLSETFIAHEIHQLERAGMRLRLYVVKDENEDKVHPVVGAIRAPLTYLPKASSLSGATLAGWLRANLPAFARAHARVALRHPLRYAHTLASALALTWRHRPRKVFVKEFLQAGEIAAALHDAGDVAHLHGHFCHGVATITWFASRISGIPFSFTAHAKDLYQAELNPGDLLERKLGAARFVATCTCANASVLRQRHPRPSDVHTIYHGLDTDYFCPAPKAAADAVPLILAVGRLVEKKGFDQLIAACGSLKRDGVRFACTIVGEDGSAGDSLRAQIERLGLVGTVTLAGAVTQDRLREIYRDARVFALPCQIMEDGDRDGFPNVLAEAMAMGVPVVSTAISGIPEMIRDGEHGLLVEPRDPPALAAALQRVLTDPALHAELARAGRARIVERFDSRRTTLELRDLFVAEMTRRRGVREEAAA